MTNPQTRADRRRFAVRTLVALAVVALAAVLWVRLGPAPSPGATTTPSPTPRQAAAPSAADSPAATAASPSPTPPAVPSATTVVTVRPWADGSTAVSAGGGPVTCRTDTVSGRSDVRLCSPYPCFVDPGKPTRVACPTDFLTRYTLHAAPASAEAGRYPPGGGEVFALKLVGGDTCRAVDARSGTGDRAVLKCRSGRSVWQSRDLDARVRSGANPFGGGLDGAGRWLVRVGTDPATAAARSVAVAYR